jgi:uncharacterized protein (DUF58 family)
VTLFRRRSPGRDRGPALSATPATPAAARSVLDAVATRLRLPAARRTRELLTGEHRSVHHGRSLELDDLRQYALGDDVRDVDWKASARTGTVLMRRHAAERKQRVILVVDTGVEMRARSAGGGPKRELVVLAAGFVGLVAAGAADLVGLVAGDAAGRLRAPARPGRAHLELVLRQVEDRLARSAAAADVLGLLDDVRRLGDRRSIVVVITDDGPFTDEHVEALRRLRMRHDVVWLSVRDADLTDVALAQRDLVDVTGAARLPALLRDDAELTAAYQQAVRTASDLRRRSLHRLGIASAEIGDDADVVPAIARLLDRVGRG